MGIQQLFENLESGKNDIWEVIKRYVPEVGLQSSCEQAVKVNAPFEEIARRKAVVILALHYSKKTEVVLSTDQIISIAKKETGSEKEIGENLPCVYVFLSLADKLCVKIGQTENARERIVNGHLRNYTDGHAANLIDYYQGHLIEKVEEDEIVALILPMFRCSQEERELVEKGLMLMLNPLMP